MLRTLNRSIHRRVYKQCATRKGAKARPAGRGGLPRQDSGPHLCQQVKPEKRENGDRAPDREQGRERPSEAQLLERRADAQKNQPQADRITDHNDLPFSAQRKCEWGGEKRDNKRKKDVGVFAFEGDSEAAAFAFGFGPLDLLTQVAGGKLGRLFSDLDERISDLDN